MLTNSLSCPKTSSIILLAFVDDKELSVTKNLGGTLLIVLLSVFYTCSCLPH